jgi:hypothetical protein
MAALAEILEEQKHLLETVSELDADAQSALGRLLKVGAFQR